MATNAATPARVISTADTKPEARPDYRRPEYRAQAAPRALCRALAAGTTGVVALGEVGLPRWPAEDPGNYRIRAASAQVARYYQRTVDASVSMVVSDPPELSDSTDPRIVADWEDIDGRGTHGEVFARQICADMIHGGFAVILVDAPPIPDGITLTLADEQALGLRPFWVQIPAERILSWIVDTPDWAALLDAFARGELTPEQVRRIAGQQVITQVVIHEPAEVPVAEFGIVLRDRYRVLTLTHEGVRFALWEKRTSDGRTGETFVEIASGPMLGARGVPLRAIPLAIGYAGRTTAPFIAEPPLLGLAELNLDHYRLSADRRYLMRLCHAPTLFLAGFDQIGQDGDGVETQIKIGPNAVLRSTDASAKASYVAADPRALDSSAQERDDLVRSMASLGMSVLGKDRTANAETATGRRLDDAAENTTHAVVARALQDLLEQALCYHAMYRGVTTDPEVSLNTTYADPVVSPQIAALLWQAVVADKMPIETFIAFLRTGQIPDEYEASEYLLVANAHADASAQQAADDAAERASGLSPSARMAGALPSAPGVA